MVDWITNPWGSLRAYWAESDRKERAKREEWAELVGWQKLGNHPKDGTAFLVRDGNGLPFPVHVDNKGRMWAHESGDLWAEKRADLLWHELQIVEPAP